MTERRPDYNILDISSQPATNGMETYNLVMYWARGKGGTCLVGNTWANFVNGQSGSGQTVTVWPSDNGYIASLPGTQTTTVYTNGVFEMSFTDTNIPPPTVEWMEKSESDGSLPDDFNANWGELSSRVVKLFTGGRAERQVQKLHWCQVCWVKVWRRGSVVGAGLAVGRWLDASGRATSG